MFDCKVKDIKQLYKGFQFTEAMLSKPIQYSIFTVDLGKAKGSIQGGVRPCIILNSFIDEDDVQTSIVIPLTSKLKAMHLPIRFVIKANPLNGLSADSVPLVEQIKCVNNFSIHKALGVISIDDCIKLYEALKVQLDVPINIGMNDVKAYFSTITPLVEAAKGLKR